MWSDDEEQGTEPVEATWEEHSQFYRSFSRFMSVSEHDRREMVRVFFIEQDVPVLESSDIDFVPTNMLSGFFLHTHKGNGSSSSSSWADNKVVIGPPISVCVECVEFCLPYISADRTNDRQTGSPDNSSYKITTL